MSWLYELDLWWIVSESNKRVSLYYKMYVNACVQFLAPQLANWVYVHSTFIIYSWFIINLLLPLIAKWVWLALLNAPPTVQPDFQQLFSVFNCVVQSKQMAGVKSTFCKLSSNFLLDDIPYCSISSQVVSTSSLRYTEYHARAYQAYTENMWGFYLSEFGTE